MAAKTAIEWAANADGTPGATWNPIRAETLAPDNNGAARIGFHCVHASEGCRNCYAETFNLRGLPGAGTGLPYAKQSESKIRIFLDEARLAIPLKRRKPTTYFLSSMTDVFADFVTDDMLDKLFAVMGLSERHTFIVLTKRADRMRAYCSTLGKHHERDRVSLAAKAMNAEHGFWYTLKDGGAFLPNVCLVVSVEDQANVDRVIDLVNTPAAFRGVSYEPALGPLVLDRRCMVGEETYWDFLRGVTGATLQHVALKPHDTPRLDWVICGGESGRHARPMHPDWARALRDQCTAAGVPFFFKQWGHWWEAEHGPVHSLTEVESHGPDRTPKPGAYGSPLEKGDALMSVDGHVVHDFEGMREGVRYRRMLPLGKGKSGRILDGRTHDERPAFWSRA